MGSQAPTISGIPRSAETLRPHRIAGSCIVWIVVRRRECLHGQEPDALRDRKLHYSVDQCATDPASLPGSFDAHDIDLGGEGRMGLYGEKANYVTSRIKTSEHRQFISNLDVVFNRRWYPEAFWEGFEHFAANGSAPLDNGSRANNSSQHSLYPPGRIAPPSPPEINGVFHEFPRFRKSAGAGDQPFPGRVLNAPHRSDAVISLADGGHD